MCTMAALDRSAESSGFILHWFLSKQWALNELRPLTQCSDKCIHVSSTSGPSYTSLHRLGRYYAMNLSHIPSTHYVLHAGVMGSCIRMNIHWITIGSSHKIFSTSFKRCVSNKFGLIQHLHKSLRGRSIIRQKKSRSHPKSMTRPLICTLHW